MIQVSLFGQAPPPYFNLWTVGKTNEIVVTATPYGILIGISPNFALTNLNFNWITNAGYLSNWFKINTNTVWAWSQNSSNALSGWPTNWAWASITNTGNLSNWFNVTTIGPNGYFLQNDGFGNLVWAPNVVITNQVGLISINGDTNTAQTFLAGTGLLITNNGANHTYSLDPLANVDTVDLIHIDNPIQGGYLIYSRDGTHLTNTGIYYDGTHVGIFTNSTLATLDVNGGIRATSVWDRSNVKYWGAIGDFATDDTAAIQNAIDANYNSTLTIPIGTYQIEYLVITNTITIVGPGTLKAKNNIANSMVYVEKAGKVKFDGLGFDGNISTVSPWSEQYHCIKILESTNVVVTGCLFTNICGDGIYISRIDGLSPPYIESKDVLIENSKFYANNDNRNGVSIVCASRVRIKGNTFYRMARPDMPGAIDSEPDHADHPLEFVNGLQITGNIFKNCTADVNLWSMYSDKCLNTLISENMSYGVVQAAFSSTTNSNVIIKNNIVNAEGPENYGMLARAIGTLGLQIIGNSSLEREGIVVIDCPEALITDNLIRRTPYLYPITVTSSPRSIVARNVIKDWRVNYSGIRLTAAANDCMIYENTLSTTNSGYGIKAENSTNLTLHLNSISNCTPMLLVDSRVNSMTVSNKIWSLEGDSLAVGPLYATNASIGTTNSTAKLYVKSDYSGWPATSGPITNAIAVFDWASEGLAFGNVTNAPYYGSWIQAQGVPSSVARPIYLLPTGGSLILGTTNYSAYRLYIEGAGWVTATLTVEGAVISTNLIGNATFATNTLHAISSDFAITATNYLPLTGGTLIGNYTTTQDTLGSDLGFGWGTSRPIWGFRVGAPPFNLILNQLTGDGATNTVLVIDRNTGNVGISNSLVVAGMITGTVTHALSVNMTNSLTILGRINAGAGPSQELDAHGVRSIALPGTGFVVATNSGDVSYLSWGTTAGTVAQGNDSRFTDARPLLGNLTGEVISTGMVTFIDRNINPTWTNHHTFDSQVDLNGTVFLTNFAGSLLMSAQVQGNVVDVVLSPDFELDGTTLKLAVTNHNPVTIDAGVSTILNVTTGQVLNLGAQSANTFLGGPTSGTATPTFRSVFWTNIVDRPTSTGASVDEAWYNIAITGTNTDLLTRAGHKKIRLTGTPDAIHTIKGMTGGTDGDCVTILNASTSDSITLLSIFNSGTVATNAFHVQTDTLVMTECVTYFYDTSRADANGYWCRLR